MDKQLSHLMDSMIETLNRRSREIRINSSEPVIKKAIVSFSYDWDMPLEDIVKTSKGKVALEHKKRTRGVSHVFYRPTDYRYEGEDIDFVKFNLLIGANPLEDAVPSMVYTYLNVMKSDLEEIVFVVNPLSRRILEDCIEVYGRFEKNIHVVDEIGETESSEILSFQHSFAKKGAGGFDRLGKDELVLLIPGDMPFTDQETINDIIYDRGIIGYDAMFDLNMFPNMFEGFSVGFEYPVRNPHYNLRNPSKKNIEEAVNYGKEPNFHVMNSKIFDYINYFAASRKNGGIKKSIKNLLFRGRRCLKDDQDFTVFEALIDMIKNESPENILKRISVMGTAFAGNFPLLATEAFNELVPQDSRLRKPLVYAVSHAEELGKKLAGVRVLLRSLGPQVKGYHNFIAHSDPSRMNDLDAAEDYAGFVGPLEFAMRLVEDKYLAESLYRNSKDLDLFRTKAMPGLRKDVAFIAQQPQIVNDYAMKLGLGNPVFHENGNLFHHTYRHQEYVKILQYLQAYATRPVLKH